MNLRSAQGHGVKTLVYVLSPVVAALVINGVVYVKRWGGSRDDDEASSCNDLLPPGWAVGAIWVLLLGLLGYSASLLSSAQRSSAKAPALVAIAALAVYCLAYPFVTRGLRYDASRVPNMIALIMATGTCLLAQAARPSALPPLLPLLAWASYVNITDAVSRCA